MNRTGRAVVYPAPNAPFESGGPRCLAPGRS